MWDDVNLGTIGKEKRDQLGQNRGGQAWTDARPFTKNRGQESGRGPYGFTNLEVFSSKVCLRIWWQEMRKEEGTVSIFHIEKDNPINALFYFCRSKLIWVRIWAWI